MGTSYENFNVLLHVRDLFTRFESNCAVLSAFRHYATRFGLDRNLWRIFNNEIDLMGRRVRDDHRFNDFRRTILTVSQLYCVRLNWTALLNDFTKANYSFNIFIYQKLYLLVYNCWIITYVNCMITFNYCLPPQLLRWFAIEDTKSYCILRLKSNFKFSDFFRLDCQKTIWLFAFKELPVNGDTVNLELFRW